MKIVLIKKRERANGKRKRKRVKVASKREGLASIVTDAIYRLYTYMYIRLTIAHR